MVIPMLRTSWLRLIPCALGLLLLALPPAVARAQSPQASIRGVGDTPRVAVVPGASVNATSMQTGIVTAQQTNEVGIYSLRFLPIGQYTLSVESAGFRRYLRQNITMTTGQALELEMVEVGQLTDSVTVSAEAPLLETRKSDAGQLVESRTVADMPLWGPPRHEYGQTFSAALFSSITTAARSPTSAWPAAGPRARCSGSTAARRRTCASASGRSTWIRRWKPCRRCLIPRQGGGRDTFGRRLG